jgi:hypothetical protein
MSKQRIKVKEGGALVSVIADEVRPGSDPQNPEKQKHSEATPKFSATSSSLWNFFPADFLAQPHLESHKMLLFEWFRIPLLASSWLVLVPSIVRETKTFWLLTTVRIDFSTFLLGQYSFCIISCLLQKTCLDQICP